MLVCHCNRLTDRAICEAACKLASEPGRQLVTPGAVFRECGVRPRCGGCFPLVIEVVHEGMEATARIADAAEMRKIA